jgi:histidinol phosphatase-like PHP family hydrolase
MTALGMTEFGLSDHLHTQYNLCDIQGARNDFLCYDRPKNFHFGIEISGLSEWERDKIAAGDYVRYYDDPVYGLRFAQGPSDSPVCIGITEKDVKDLGIEYVIAGVHWPLYSSPEEAYYDFFRQQLYLIENPLVDILAHPWDAIEMAAGDWYHHRDKDHIKHEAILNIPQEYNDKLLEALLKHNKCAEINLSVVMGAGIPEECRKYYWNLLAQWREAGVKFTIGSDQHSAHYVPIMFSAAELLLDAYGFKDSDIKYFFE